MRFRQRWPIERHGAKRISTVVFQHAPPASSTRGCQGRVVEEYSRWNLQRFRYYERYNENHEDKITNKIFNIIVSFLYRLYVSPVLIYTARKKRNYVGGTEEIWLRQRTANVQGIHSSNVSIQRNSLI